MYAGDPLFAIGPEKRQAFNGSGLNHLYRFQGREWAIQYAGVPILIFSQEMEETFKRSPYFFPGELSMAKSYNQI